jgi:hypothetical protein
MMNIYHVKLRNGTDLISAGVLNTSTISLEDPVEVINDMGSLIAVPWLQLSKERTATIPMNMIAAVNTASDEAASYYASYLRRSMIQSATQAESELLLAIEESQSVQKH